MNIIFSYISKPPYIDSPDFRNFLLRNPFEKMDTQVTELEKRLISILNAMFPNNIFTLPARKVDRYLLVQKMIEHGNISPENILQLNESKIITILRSLDGEFINSITIKSSKASDSTNTTLSAAQKSMHGASSGDLDEDLDDDLDEDLDDDH